VEEGLLPADSLPGYADELMRLATAIVEASALQVAGAGGLRWIDPALRWVSESAFAGHPANAAERQ